MNRTLKIILIIAGIILVMVIIPKPYHSYYRSDCVPFPNGGSDSGWCVGLIYPVNKQTERIAPSDSLAKLKNQEYCIDIEKIGFECIGIPIFRSGVAIA